MRTGAHPFVLCCFILGAGAASWISARPVLAEPAAASTPAPASAPAPTTSAAAAAPSAALPATAPASNPPTTAASASAAPRAVAPTETTSESPPAPAPASKDDKVPDEPYTRRGGFTVGVSLGFGLGTAHGYPDDLNKIGDPAYRTGVSGLASSFTLWLGGALTDWFTFAIGSSSAGIGGKRLDAVTGGLVFRIEAFPAFSSGGIYRDLGVFAQFGTGTGYIREQSAPHIEFAKSGSLSMAGVGAFWEPWRLGHGHLNAGPFVAYEFRSADSLTQQVGVIGLRGALYLSP